MVIQPMWWILGYGRWIFIFFIAIFVLFSRSLEFKLRIILNFAPASSLCNYINIIMTRLLIDSDVTITWFLRLFSTGYFLLCCDLILTLFDIIISWKSLRPEIHMKNYQIANTKQWNEVDTAHDENLRYVKVQETCGQCFIIQSNLKAL